jgi:type I restriction enzyme, S subunit
MQLKKGYKKTEMGTIPEDWDVFELGEIINYTKGFAFKSSYYQSDGTRIVRVSDTTFDSITDENCVYIDSKKANNYRNWRLRENDLIITTVGSKPPVYSSLVGKVIKVVKKYDGSLLNQNAVLIRAKDYKIHKQQLLFSNLRTERYVQHIEAIYRGNANQASITLDELFKFQLALPKNDKEQRAIAAALSDMDALITSLDKLIAKKRLIKHAAMQQLLTGETRLPGFRDDWRFLELREIVTQFIVPMRDKPKTFRGNIPWCRIEDFEGKVLYDSKSNQYVDEDIIELMNLKVHPKGTLLVSCSADLGRCAIVGRPLVSNQTFIGLVFDNNKTSNEFFYYYMTFFAQQLNNLSSGTTISYLSREQFETFKVKAPIGKTEQQAIATVLSDIDDEIVALEQRRDKTRLLKLGILQELLTGRIRLHDV